VRTPDTNVAFRRRALNGQKWSFGNDAFIFDIDVV
jgi:hypothetical protein